MESLRNAVAVFAIVSFVLGIATGQDEKAQKSALGVRQRQIERMMSDIELKFSTLADKLEATGVEAEVLKARKLRSALQKSTEFQIRPMMVKITEYLDESRLDEANAAQNQVIGKLDDLIKVLRAENEDEAKKKQEELDKLKKFKQELETILKEQREGERESAKIANKDQALDDLDKQIKKVKDLVKQQEKINQDTQESSSKGSSALDRIANKQHDVRKATEKVAEDIGKSGNVKVGKVAQPDESKGNPESAESKSGDLQNGSKPNGDSKGPPKSGDSKSGDSKSGTPMESGSTSEQQNRPSEAGEKSLKEASRNQKAAEDNLAKGKADQAQREEKKALDNLKNALSDLENEKRRLAQLPKEAFDQMAKKQGETKKKTDQLAKDMKSGSQSGGQTGEPSTGQAQPGSGEQAQKTPGQQNVQNAKQAMENAQKSLEEQDAEVANRQQKKAIADIKKALEDIEKRLDQLREETQEEKLARLEARFAEMLAKQQIASQKTYDLDNKKRSFGKFSRGDRLGLIKVKGMEKEIAGSAQLAYEILMEDGTSVIFPEIVMEIKEDLLRVSDMMGKQEVGRLVQIIQKDIETSLEEFLDALKKQRREKKSGGGGGG
ncbi:MAG: hypothetical protein VX438_19595, partial [Planctomycetota bacterium]|nr:hypothetical protein [Planctomycetota bacterium]